MVHHHVVLAEVPRGDLTGRLCRRFRSHQHRIARRRLNHSRIGAEAGGLGLDDIVDAGQHLAAQRFVVGPNREFHFKLAWNHVERAARVNTGDADDRAVVRADITRDDRLQHLDDGRPGHDGVARSRPRP
ncbi:hypothetical protein G6F68_017328 [Rhizopus microsporus]|nr:hypothetical protein G6F68_017328 [Rhizopus microsporus]